MARTIVILGGSYAGLTLAHKLLKDTLPSVPDLQVILISPSSHLYWNLASVRAVIPGALHNQKISQSFLPSFAYAGSAFKFIQGTAEKVDDANKFVIVRTENGQIVTKFFDYCVVATGRRAVDEMPWTAGGLKIQKKLLMLKVLQGQIERANSIVIGGGGATAIQLAGELASHYGRTKKITLIYSTPHPGTHIPLPSPSIKHLTRLLSRKHISLQPSTRITDAVLASNGQTNLMLSNGERKLVDLYIPCCGTTPSTSFLPEKWLGDGASGKVNVNRKLRVRGSKCVFAIGDVAEVAVGTNSGMSSFSLSFSSSFSSLSSSSSSSTSIFSLSALKSKSKLQSGQGAGGAAEKQLQVGGWDEAIRQAVHLASNFHAVMTAGEPVVYRPLLSGTVLVPVGKRGGVGYIMGWKVPGWVVGLLWGRRLGMERMEGVLNGNVV